MRKVLIACTWEGYKQTLAYPTQPNTRTVQSQLEGSWAFLTALELTQQLGTMALGTAPARWKSVLGRWRTAPTPSALDLHVQHLILRLVCWSLYTFTAHMRESHLLSVAGLENKFLQIMSAVNDTFIKHNKNLCCYVLCNLFIILIQYKNSTQITQYLFCLQFQWRVRITSSSVVIAHSKTVPVMES